MKTQTDKQTATKYEAHERNAITDRLQAQFAETDSRTVASAFIRKDGGGRYHIKEGDSVIHEDQHGQSEGVADSNAMASSNRIKVSFTSGPRKGECRWVLLENVICCPENP